jgi:serine/threonine protein kinase
MKKMYAPMIKREVEIWRHLRHGHVVQLYEVVVTETKVHLVWGGACVFSPLYTLH